MTTLHNAAKDLLEALDKLDKAVGKLDPNHLEHLKGELDQEKEKRQALQLQIKDISVRLNLTLEKLHALSEE